MNRDIVLSILRHTLTTVGGAMAAQGSVSESDATAIAGGIVALAGVIWAIIEKRRRAG